MPRSTNECPVIMHQNPQSHIAEAYRLLRTNVEYCSPDHDLKTIAITSAIPREGKTTTAVNLAIAFAHKESNVLLIDADLRQPSIHRIFHKHNRGGLTNVILNQNELLEMVQETSIPHLSILTSGPVPPNPAELLSSKRMTQILHQLEERFDIILIDTPPVLGFTDTPIVATKSDGVLIVLQAGKTKRGDIMKSKQLLGNVKANVLGVILNQATSKSMKEQLS
ncbi:capsular biosynthesis protein [Xylanibacillus composti]|uniref:non-specific protein-tyrosine kinase n=1 Tax=Xylanibacillus composti TaxID=1572762 RepID=A0A8J4H2P4_9BACL|nr:CpsD/CapB family tyrosine-protein kinase [Xylanibacillus composti]MDT9724516.1 capsular biosynthesis protein [Xylanibacillus composti]GIQ69779.1 tyrosine protein kinase [Xylanibacillus composti]